MSFMSPEDLPPDVREQIEAQQRHAAAIQERAMATELEWRATMARWGGLTCGCRKWFAWSHKPPQRNCPLHGNILVSLDGKQVR